MTLAFVDFETRSEAKLKQVGARVYAEHPSTQIMCAALALDNGPVEIWREIDEKPLLAWLNERVSAGATWVFHNCEFEMAIFRSSLGYMIPIESVIDTAAVARAANLPGKLEDLGDYLGFPKDVEGQRIMVKLARPRQPSKENRDRFWRPETKPEDFEALYRYNPRDVEVSREAYKRLPRMSDRERRIFELTWRMNERGLPIDMEAVRRMERLVLDAKAGLNAECFKRYGFVLSQTARVTEALGAHSIAKAPLRDFLKGEPGNWLAQARQAYAKASTAKLSSIRNHVASDGCVHGSVVYAGAERTVRFCIAKGQRVLTKDSSGRLAAIPIETVTTGHLVWDGVDWVRHGGVVFSGTRKVVTWGPLTASHTHEVFVSDHERMPMAQAIVERRMLWSGYVPDIFDSFADGREVCRHDLEPASAYGGAQGERTEREPAASETLPLHSEAYLDCAHDRDPGAGHIFAGGSLSAGAVFHREPEHPQSARDEPYRRRPGYGLGAAGTTGMVPSEPAREIPTGVSRIQNGHEVSAQGLPLLSMERKAVDQLRVGQGRETTVSRLGAGGEGPCEYDRREPLREGGGPCMPHERAMGARSAAHGDAISCGQGGDKYPEENAGCALVLGATEGQSRSICGIPSETRMASCYDILNAGPRNRFMVEGVVVSNSGAGIQPQNIPRGYGKNSDAAFELLPYPELFTFAYDPIAAISNMLRGVITRLGRKLNVADFAQIEARLLAWLAGQQDILDVFARGGDPYREMAARIYHKAVAQVTDNERFMGKQATLACGYGLGKDGFRSLLDVTYDVQIDREEAGKIVTAYRSASPEVVKFWERVERAVSIARINPGKLIEIRAGLHLYARWESPTEFHIILPSGRRLRFVDVKWDKDKTAFGRDRASDGGYGPVKLYGGKLVGIITQSLARDIMCEAMLRLEDLGHQIILTVHDEVVSLDDDNFGQFREVMVQSPAWLTDFPLKADTFQTERYRK